MTITRRRAAAVGAAAAMALTLVACGNGDTGNGDPTGGPDDGNGNGADIGSVGAMDDFGVGTTFVATEDLTFSMLYRDHPNYPISNDWRILTALQENQNVSFDLVNAPLSDYEQRRSLLIGAGDAPEIITVTYPGQEVPFVAGGAILAVSDYVEHMPNFQEKVASWDLQESIDAMRQEDGKYYLLPGLRESIRPQYTFAVRSDIWDELGLSYEPATFDDFADDLRTVNEAYPDAWPLSDRWELNATLNFVAPNYMTAAGWGYGEGVYWDEDAGEFIYTGASEGYRQMVEYFAGLVADGLLDPESLTQDDDQALQKLGSGRSLAIGANDQEVLRYRAAFEEAGEEGADVRMIRVPAGPAGDNYAAGSRLQNGVMLSSSVADSDNFLALLQFLDWLYYSDEGLEFAKWGIEGETFEWDGDQRVLNENIDINGLNPGAPEALNVDYGFHNGVWMLEHGSSIDLDLSMLREEVVEFVESMQDKVELPLAPNWPLTDIEREQASLWQGALADHVTQNTARFILGQRSLDEWDTYVSELEAMNMQQYLDVVNEAQQRFAGSS